MWEVEDGVDYVNYKILQQWDSCDCMLFSKIFYTNLYRKCPDEEPVTVEKRIQNNQKEFGSASLGEGVVFAMNTKGKCMYQSQKQKKNSWMAAGSLSVWESNPVFVHTSHFPTTSRVGTRTAGIRTEILRVRCGRIFVELNR